MRMIVSSGILAVMLCGIVSAVDPAPAPAPMGAGIVKIERKTPPVKVTPFTAARGEILKLRAADKATWTVPPEYAASLDIEVSDDMKTALVVVKGTAIDGKYRVCIHTCGADKATTEYAEITVGKAPPTPKPPAPVPPPTPPVPPLSKMAQRFADAIVMDKKAGAQVNVASLINLYIRAESLADDPTITSVEILASTLEAAAKSLVGATNAPLLRAEIVKVLGEELPVNDTITAPARARIKAIFTGIKSALMELQ